MFNSFLDTIQFGRWKFHVIQIEDMDMYTSYIRKTRYPANLWSSNFAYMWAISRSDNRKLLWKIVDGLLVTFVHTNKDFLYLYCLPFGDADSEQVIAVTQKCMRYCLEWNNQEANRPLVRMINADQLDFLAKSPHFNEYFTKKTWQGIERHFDINKLVLLTGKDFSRVRNRLHKFYREHPDAKISQYQDTDYKELIELDKHWKNTSGLKYANIFDGVYYKELVKHSAELDQLTLVIRIDKKIIGMISGGILPTGQSWASVIKFEDNIPGLSETLFVEFAKKIHTVNPKVELMNVGSDLGSEGLRAYKLKFMPVLNLKRYQIYLKQADYFRKML